MSLTDELEHAGAQAAARPVQPPPTIEQLGTEVRRRKRRRSTMVGSALASCALLVGVIFVAAQGGDDERPSLLTAAQPDDSSAENATSTVAPSTTVAEPDIGREPENDGELDHTFPDIDLDLTIGDGVSIEVLVLSGDEAAVKASDAEASADETREIDGMTIWIERDDDATTVAALIEPDTFAEVTGPAESLESLLDMLDEDSPFFPLGPDFGEGFGGGFDGDFGELPDDFTFEDFPFEGLPFDDLLPPELRERLDELEKEFAA